MAQRGPLTFNLIPQSPIHRAREAVFFIYKNSTRAAAVIDHGLIGIGGQ